MSTDLLRHLWTGLTAAVVPVILHFAAGFDWSSLGPYAVFVQGAVQIATEIWNQISPKA
jgi:hypothetical protein